MKTLNISVPDGKTAEWVNGVLTLVDEQKEDLRPIEERVKTYEDACKILGIKPINFGENDPFIGELDEECDDYGFKVADLPKHLITLLKLETVIKALNEGWAPELKEDENRYYPWFYFYTQKELDDMDQEEKDKRSMIEFGGLLFGGNAYNGTFAGFGYAYTIYAPSFTTASIGSRLCLKNDQLATYCGKQFIDLWFGYLFPEREITKRHNNI